MTTVSLTDQAIAALTTFHAALLQHGEIVIRVLDDPEMDGLTTFGDHAIYIHRDLGPEKFRATLIHELLHLLRGPSGADPWSIAREEDTIEAAVAQMFLPEVSALAQQHIPATGRHALAQHYEVDPDTLDAALDPPTQPMGVVVPLARHPVDQAARRA